MPNASLKLGNTEVFSEASGVVTLGNSTLASSVKFPAGHIIQIVNNYGTSGSSATNSQTLQRDPNFSGTINNVLENSHVLILTSYEAFVGTVGTEHTQQQLNHAYGLFRGTTNIYESATDVFYSNPLTGGNVYGQMPIFFHFIDTSPAVGTNVYYNGIKSHTSGYRTQIRGAATTRFITLFEIAQ